ncbi:PQQ-dependent sugar dehydrogenase [Mycobacterium sp. MBM]|nr:PQQ-dependent sugar dehydrogenase [Mycobacterium sp. MBM]
MASSDRAISVFGAARTTLTGEDLTHRQTPADGPRPISRRGAVLGAATGSVYARYIGRVGALAVALGVTGAMATSPGVAWADPTPGSSSSTRSADTGSSPTANGSTGPSGAGAAEQTATGTTVGDDDGDEDGGEDGGGEGTDKDDETGEDPSDPDDGTGIESDLLDGGTGETAIEDDDTELDTELNTGNQLGTDTDTDTDTGSDPDDAPAKRPLTAAASSASHRDDDLLSTADDTTTGFAARRSDLGAPMVAASTAITPLHTPAAAPNSLGDWGNAIGTALHLPTPNQVFRSTRSFVVGCACAIINGALDLLSGLMAPAASADAPANPLQNTILWTVLGWARRQIDYAVGAFNRSLLGQWVHQVGVNARQWVGDIGNSPFGRTISARIGAFVAECEGRVALPDEFDRTTLISGLNEPTDFELITHDGDATHIHRILITEKSGAIKSYDMHTGQITTLANLAVVTANGERGLIGIEVDPHYWDSDAAGYQKIYVAYTNAQNYDQLSSFTLIGDTLSDEQVLVTSTLLANDFHHGGELEFDPTGQYLYWAVGNNTSPSENSQDLTNIHGKILRLNRDGSGVTDNPFYVEGGDPNTNRIYALGLRNPFRFGVDPDNGAVLSGDVGEATWEELNLIKPGANYGWPTAEGAQGGGFADPLYAYPHATGFGNGSITAVMVYDDGTPVAGQKTVWIADYSLGWIRELTFDDQYTSLISERTVDSGAGSVVKLTQGPGGEIYQLNIYPGALMVIRPSEGNRSPVAVIDASATSGAGDSLTVDFDAGGSSDPDNDTLSYAWDFGNGETSTSATHTVTFTNTGNYTAYNVSLTVTDELGKQSVTTQRIVVGSTPPVADFDVPAGADYMYNAGETVSFSATGADPQDGALAAGAYSWKVVFHHADHTHPFINEITGPDLSFDIPVDFHQLSNTYYNVVLTVTDSSGLKTVVEKEIHPNLVTLTFGSNVDGAKYTIDGIPHTGTYTEQAVVGVHRTLGAISPQTINGQQYVFDGWEHGGDATQVITTPGSATTYTISYVPAPAIVPV